MFWQNRMNLFHSGMKITDKDGDNNSSWIQKSAKIPKKQQIFQKLKQLKLILFSTI